MPAWQRESRLNGNTRSGESWFLVDDGLLFHLRVADHLSRGESIPAIQVTPKLLWYCLRARYRAKMECPNPGDEIRQEVASGVHDDHYSEVVRIHKTPRNKP